MGRREMLVWCCVMVCASLAVAWLVERQHVRAFRLELDRWGHNNEEGATHHE